MKTPLWLSAPLLSILPLACATEPQLAEPAQLEQAILGGEYDDDAANHAVVAVGLTDDSYCTGTLFHVDGNVGYVLTAAHCAPFTHVLFGSDYDTPELSVAVLPGAAFVDPRYDESTPFGDDYDLAILRISSPSLSNYAPIPLAEGDDGLQVGTQVRSSGYGLTEPDYDSENSRRKTVRMPISELAPGMLYYQQSLQSGGVCSGDSGGPVLHGEGDARRVVGVHAFGRDERGVCQGLNASVRISAHHDFVQAVLRGQPLPTTSDCLSCAHSSEAAALLQQRERTCENDTHCSALAWCLESAQTAAAERRCHAQHPLGAGPLQALNDALCAAACGEVCGAHSACRDTPRCGFPLSDAPLRACAERSCCAELDAAAANGLGYVCLQDATTEGCAENPQYQAFVQCAQSADCLTGDGNGGTSSGGSSSGGSSSGGSSSGGSNSGGDNVYPDIGEPAFDTFIGGGGCHAAPGSAASSALSALAALLGLRLRRKRGGGAS